MSITADLIRGNTDAIILAQLMESNTELEDLKDAIKKNIADLIPKHITIEDIINRFAPDNENDTKSYVHSVLVFLHSRNVKVEEGIIVDGDWLNVEIISHDVAPDSIVRFGTDLFYHLCLAIMFIESNYLTTIDALKSITNSFNIF